MDRRSVIELLEMALASASLKTASFGQIFPENPNYPTKESDVTDFIRERVDLHHRTWIIGPIEEALEKLKG